MCLQGKRAAEREEKEKTGIVPGTEGACVCVVLKCLIIPLHRHPGNYEAF